MTDGFNSCRNVVCNFTEGINIWPCSKRSRCILLMLQQCFFGLFCALLIRWVLFRCHVFIPSNSIATKSFRDCSTGWKSCRCLLLSQAFGSHWHIHCSWFRIWTERRVKHSSLYFLPFPTYFFMCFF